MDKDKKVEINEIKNILNNLKLEVNNHRLLLRYIEQYGKTEFDKGFDEAKRRCDKW